MFDVALAFLQGVVDLFGNPSGPFFYLIGFSIVVGIFELIFEFAIIKK